MYKIVDWAGNDCLTEQVFSTFEEAWDYIDERFQHLDGEELDNTLSEYEVVAVDQEEQLAG